ncbi:hypothetical protein BV898_16571 [Hypsibius exemplaris]|uniref:Receptor ligand binding region domain-containing protein n=1 Tax=Hypsibius exemplaris TaxID=2072580 RepID=A0A9X6NF37_HYPEX|nr:hypothetical protein BV898_16571 [Hypsibius exemplaris]
MIIFSAMIAIDQSLTNAQRYPTVVAFPSSDQTTLIRAIMFLLDQFSWTTVSLICEDPNLKVSEGGVYYYTACRGFLTVLGGQKNKYNLHVHYFDPKVKEGNLDAYSSVLRNAATQSRAKTAVITLAVSISTALLATLAIFIAMYHCIFGRSGHGAGRPWWDLQPDLLFVIPKTTAWKSLSSHGEVSTNFLLPVF